MKYLKIENNKGHYLSQLNEWTEIDKISKEDLMYLLNNAITDDFEMDEYLEESIGHKAHQIVYKSIQEKFSELLGNKNVFKDECDSLFKTAIEKYEVTEEE
ncbi:hypothetical protein PG913_08500 [Tenacibaculum pacificus]|uniref:hypothetical protein n=1 Tax=Tenacibaculum TaxID=104267 RepID=UPI0022F38818|nr:MULTISPECIES: hypothetical protein [Tenacibaculum]WBX72940.1 hypothetical protein PG913_08500 [Tenacibaculum pacificus]WCC46247.1 hypothetical protein PJH08_07515 [Tenacibaculum finnmarkense]